MSTAERRIPRLPNERLLENEIVEIEAEIEARTQDLARVREDLRRLQDELASLQRLARLLEDVAASELHDLACSALIRALTEVALSPVDVGDESASLLSRNGAPLALVVTIRGGHVVSLDAVARGFRARAALGKASVDLPVALVVDVCQDSGLDGPARRRVPVSRTIAAEARRSRILLLRTFDLWQLVAEAQSRGTIESLFDEGLERGGWLRVEERVELLPT